jgi:hypothetical protein
VVAKSRTSLSDGSTIAAAKIRRAHFVQGKSIKQKCREYASIYGSGCSDASFSADRQAGPALPDTMIDEDQKIIVELSYLNREETAATRLSI